MLISLILFPVGFGFSRDLTLLVELWNLVDVFVSCASCLLSLPCLITVGADYSWY